MFGDVLGVILWRVFHELLSIGIHHAHHAVVEIDLVILVHGAHIIRAMSVHIAEDEINILLVAKDNINEELQAELGELNRPATHLFDLFSLIFRNSFSETTRNGCARMDFASANDFNSIVSILARLNNLAADLEPNFVNHAEDISFCYWRIGTHHEVGSTERIKMCSVIGEVKRGIK